MSQRLLFLTSVFFIATCGLIYELTAGTVASYLLGDSVMQFSTVIGVYLSAMGVGSWLSKFVERQLVVTFIRIEFVIALIGGGSAAMFFVAFGWIGGFRILLYTTIFIIGALVGLEIPLLLRILRDRLEFKDLVAQVLALDYVGALLASLLFPLVLVPHIGLMRSCFLFGILNAGVGLAALWLLREEIPRVRQLGAGGLAVCAILGWGFVASEELTQFGESTAYVDRVIHARSTAYQRLVLTRDADDLRLYLNGNLQFSSRDEYRYHEALVHPSLSRLPQAKEALVLGGGDGLAVREILKYPNVERITLVDLDPEMTRMFATQELLVGLNEGALNSPRVQVVNADAFIWLRECRDRFDLIVADFPDPSNFSLGKLYSTAFFDRARAVLRPGGALVAQCTSPWVARKSFWCVNETLRASGFQTMPYHAYVPSFGEWGFIIASDRILEAPAKLPDGLRFVTAGNIPSLFEFPPDMAPLPVDVNKLTNQALVRYFEAEWAKYVH